MILRICLIHRIASVRSQVYLFFLELAGGTGETLQKTGFAVMMSFPYRPAKLTDPNFGKVNSSSKVSAGKRKGWFLGG